MFERGCFGRAKLTQGLRGENGGEVYLFGVSEEKPKPKPSKPAQPNSNSDKRGKPFSQAHRTSLGLYVLGRPSADTPASCVFLYHISKTNPQIKKHPNFEERMACALQIKIQRYIQLYSTRYSICEPAIGQYTRKLCFLSKTNPRIKNIPILKSAWLARFELKLNAIFSYIQPDIQFASPLWPIHAEIVFLSIIYPKRTLGSKTSQF
ncbi:hypothetical protein B0H14DRAFT_2560465 [Mycena olivaceomarginata]|nr:hypothetical protein B0H14DRAFT_2560465 [Mycena olivaceomarginata]